jgi:hypothetical protein
MVTRTADTAVAAGGGSASNTSEGLNTAAQFGAGGDGITDDLNAFNALKSLGGLQYIGPGDYYLSADVVWPDADASVRIHPDASFPGPGEPDFTALLHYHGKQIGLELTRHTWGNEVLAYPFGAFQFGQQAISNVVGGRAVALYGQGEARADGASAWGGNAAGVALGVGSTAVAWEFTAVKMNADPTSLSTGIGVFGKGTYQNNTAIAIATGGAVNAFINGIVFDNDRPDPAVTGTVFESANSVAEIGIDLGGSVFSAAEMLLPSMVVSATLPGLEARLAVRGGTEGAGVDVFTVGTGEVPATDQPLNLSSLGSGAINVHTNGRNGTRQMSITHGAGIIFENAPRLPSFTVATVPSAAALDRGLIHVSDEGGGEVIAFSDGDVWRRVTDRSVVS